MSTVISRTWMQKTPASQLAQQLPAATFWPFHFIYYFFVLCKKCFAWVRHSNRSTVCVIFLYFCMSEQQYVCRIFNMRTYTDACDCTRGLYRCCKRVCAGSGLWEKNPLPHQGLEPASVLCLAFQSDALPTEMFPQVMQAWTSRARH